MDESETHRLDPARAGWQLSATASPLDERLLVVNAYNGHQLIAYRGSGFDGVTAWFSDQSRPIFGITHWRPLPNPPQLEEECMRVTYASDVSLKDREIVYVKGDKMFDRHMKQIGILKKKAVAPPQEKTC